MKGTSLIVFAIALGLSIGSAAAKDKDKDKGNHGGKHAEAQHEERGGGHFGDHDRIVVRDYYVEAARGGHCPPGLAKKNNGCLPPGQARKWAVGRPLPAGVVYAPIPSALVVQLTPPPVGYRYVRVAGDILLLAAGTNMVVDAIQDLGR